MESSSPCVQEHEFFDFLLQLFQSNQQPSKHVEEADAGRKTRKRGTCGCEIKPMRSSVSKTANQSPIALGSSASCSPGALKAQSSNSDLTGTGRPAGRGLRGSTASSSQVRYSDVNSSSSTRRFVAETTKNPIGTTIISPQLGHIQEQCWPSYESLLERTTKTESSTGRRYA